MALRRAGDEASEREELERVIAVEPGNLAVLDRLNRLATKNGKTARAAELDRQKSDMERALTRYEALYDRKQPIRDAVEMARLAEQLGRMFEARVYLSLATAEDPDLEGPRHDLARLNAVAPPARDPRQTLAEALARRPVSARNQAMTPRGSSALGPM